MGIISFGNNTDIRNLNYNTKLSFIYSVVVKMRDKIVLQTLLNLQTHETRVKTQNYLIDRHSFLKSRVI